MMRVNNSCLVLLLVALAVYSTISTAQSPDCSMLQCNATDPNCDVVGKRCEQNYRMCCDRSCHHKRSPCRDLTPEHENKNYSQYVRNLNASAYQRELEVAKQKIIAWAKERPCWPEEKCVNRTTCLPQYQHCSNGECTELLSNCGFWWEKNDYTQKKNVTCYPDELCFRTNCKTGYWMCDDGECVNEQVVCRGGADCSDGSDETRCSGKCYPPFRCSNGSCKHGFFGCSNGECILQEHVCDTIAHCTDGSDEFNCSGSCWPVKHCNSEGNCRPGYFKCDEDKCIAEANLCDGRSNCEDGTDEIRGEHGFKCLLGQNYDTCVLPQAMVLDTTTNCADYADNCMVHGTSRCFTCLDQKLVIADNQRCDGVIDCFDMSDECLCLHSEAEHICQSVCLHGNSNQTTAEHKALLSSSHIPPNCNCPPGKFDCGNDICLNISQVCNGIPDCGGSGFDERNCESISHQQKEKVLCSTDAANSSLVEAVMCDGRPECPDLSDECNKHCNNTALFCNIKKLFDSESNTFEFLCNKAGLYFDAKKICDGKWTPCMPRIEEEEQNCPSRYYCKSGDSISIDLKLVCDGVPQCDDRSDENNCTDRFYCENEVPFSVPISYKLDGKGDCSDFSDECPKDLDRNALSSRKEMLSYIGFRVTTWIIAALATFGNIITFVGTFKSLWSIKNAHPITKMNYMLLINLSIADGLMGIYLLILCIKSLEFSGVYCLYDKIWRTSSTCTGLGVLALTSSQASVLILVLLTTLRLYSILYPAKTNQVFLKSIFVSLIMVWIIAIIVALLPTLPSLMDFFVSDIWMPTNFTNLEARGKESMITFVHRLAAIQPVTQPPIDSSWITLTGYLKEYYPALHIKGYFGYYSDSSVCLPKFFASLGEAGWGYSTGIIIFNFIAFIYICIAYGMLFHLTTPKQINSLQAKRMKEVQSRVARLVITDFCCWIPICLMNFIQLSGVNIPNSAYAISAVILLPINSALNPLLHSDVTTTRIKQISRKIFGSDKLSEILWCPNDRNPRQSSQSYSNYELDIQPSAVTEEKSF